MKIVMYLHIVQYNLHQSLGPATTAGAAGVLHSAEEERLGNMYGYFTRSFRKPHLKNLCLGIAPAIVTRKGVLLYNCVGQTTHCSTAIRISWYKAEITVFLTCHNRFGVNQLARVFEIDACFAKPICELSPVVFA